MFHSLPCISVTFRRLEIPLVKETGAHATEGNERDTCFVSLVLSVRYSEAAANDGEAAKQGDRSKRKTRSTTTQGISRPGAF